ncbi:hypothetical protein [Nitrococcus mobilis]|uniref:Uncharacterized protein n=1 Tax=Nitrococcus mobilis Nb-231 TaxID=314278 RepID=A4BU33_9GAMM|nr:hypothetical protein [Nitrococcus mobilis]EAR20707.1 hypothetical protein NB231_12491 [Nitrococcus mobilis Nb-231]
MENVFRYMAVRGPQRLRSANTLVPIDVPPQNRSDFRQQLAQLKNANADRTDFAQAAVAHQQTVQFVEPLAGPFRNLYELEIALGGSPLSAGELLATATDVFGLDPGNAAAELRALLQSQDGLETRRRLVDAILSITFVPPPPVHVPDELVRSIKLVHLLSLAAAGRWPFDVPHSIDLLIDRLVPVVPTDVFSIKAGRPQPKGGGAPGNGDAGDDLDRRISSLNASLAELTQPHLLMQLEPGDPLSFTGANYTPPRTGFFSLFDFGGGEEDSIDVPPDRVVTAPGVRLSGSAYDGLSKETRETLTTLGFGRENTNLAAASQIVGEELARAEAQAAPAARYSLLFGNMLISMSGFQPRSTGGFTPVITPAALLPLSCIHYAGQGELRIVRQELIAYELADIAHIENVLAGEEKERTHRRLDRREEVERELVEEITQSERDLQSTERHELEAESQRTAQLAVNVEGGLTVTGSYGPSVSFTANASAGFSYQSETSSRRASRFAREVVDRTVERIKERILRERQVIRIREVEETNLHGLRNASAGARHIRGVYRWLNKIYRAQVYTYGMRNMFEFIVPEPAAFYLWSLVKAQTASTPLPELDPPDFGPEGITERNWFRKAAEYGAQGVQPPPPQLTFVSHATSLAAQERAYHTATHEFKVPDGYEAFGAVCNVARASAGLSKEERRSGKHRAGWRLMVHNAILAGGKEDKVEAIFFGGDYVSGQVPVGFRDWNNFSYVIAVNLMCIRTDAHMSKWRYDTFSAIQDAYRDYQADYQARLAQAEIGEGIQVLGRNPAENGRIIRDELQRSCLSLLTGTDLEDYDGFQPTGEAGEWRLDKARALHEGSEARFFQHAFEWENMTYVFYPYFWGRSGDRWINVLHQFGDPDPNLATFVKAGMARVQVPVRPGFEAVVARYCQDGELWAGDDAPLIGEDLHVPIIDEIKRELEAPDEGVPVDDPWEYRVPTSLVLLEDAGNLVGFRDPLFGGQNGESNIVFQPPEGNPP